MNGTVSLEENYARTQVLERYLQSHQIQRWMPFCNHRVQCTRSRKQKRQQLFIAAGKKNQSADDKYFDKLFLLKDTTERTKWVKNSWALLHCDYTVFMFNWWFFLSCSTFLPQISVNTEVLQGLQTFISHSASPLGNKYIRPEKWREGKPEAPLDLGEQSNQCIKSVQFTISSEAPSLAFIRIPLRPFFLQLWHWKKIIKVVRL